MVLPLISCLQENSCLAGIAPTTPLHAMQARFRYAAEVLHAGKFGLGTGLHRVMQTLGTFIYLGIYRHIPSSLERLFVPFFIFFMSANKVEPHTFMFFKNSVNDSILS